MIAEKVGIDAIALRERHILSEGEVNVSGQVTNSMVREIA